MYALSLATEGHLGCKDAQPLAIAAVGHLCLVDDEIVLETIPFDRGGGYDSASIQQEYNEAYLKDLRLEDEEILLFIKAFMICR